MLNFFNIYKIAQPRNTSQNGPHFSFYLFTFLDGRGHQSQLKCCSTHDRKIRSNNTLELNCLDKRNGFRFRNVIMIKNWSRRDTLTIKCYFPINKCIQLQIELADKSLLWTNSNNRFQRESQFGFFISAEKIFAER